MSVPSGYNPMRWDCNKRGCFNVKQRPKIELFAGCFPGRISFGDVDAIVEINGHGLMFEMKSEPMNIPTGQRIMHERLTATGALTTMCVAGNAETMEITHSGIFFKGSWDGWQQSSFEEVGVLISDWVAWAKSQKVTLRPPI